MEMIDFACANDKIIVLLARHRNDFEQWYVREHAPALADTSGLSGYLANVGNHEFDAVINAYVGYATDPWGVAAADELYGVAWGDICNAYANCKILGAYAVTEYLIRGLHTDRPVGQPGPEIKRVCLLTRPENKTHEEAMEYWISSHPPKCFIHHSGMAAYTQNHIRQLLTPNSLPINGFANLTYWNLDALKYGHFSRPDSRQVILDDTRGFRSTSYPVTMTEYVMKANAY